MTEYVIRRLVGLIPVLLIGSMIIFFSLRVFTPVDIIEDSLSQSVAANDAALKDQLRKEFGLDKPVVVQYANWLMGAVRGDFGTSWRTGKPVGENILNALPVSLEITALSLILAVF